MVFVDIFLIKVCGNASEIGHRWTAVVQSGNSFNKYRVCMNNNAQFDAYALVGGGGGGERPGAGGGNRKVT